MEKFTKKQKGITLIALIITIIVMLILVAVTINVAINGGLFERAKNAQEDTQREADREELLSYVTGAYDKFGNFDGTTFTEKITANNWQVTPNQVDDKVVSYTCVSPKNNKFTVDAKGNITYVGKNTGEIGGVTPEEETPVVETGWTYNEDTKTYTKGSITLIGDSDTGYIDNNQVLAALGKGNSAGTYNGEWAVLSIDGKNLKLVSTDNVTNVTLGYDDPNAIRENPAEDESSPTRDEFVKRAIWSYRNSYNTIKDAIKIATNIDNAENVKLQDIYSIVGNNINKGTNYGKIYNYRYDENKDKVVVKYKTSQADEWSEETATYYPKHTFLDNNLDEKVVGNPIQNLEEKHTVTYDAVICKLSDTQKDDLGCLANGSYWLGDLVACPDQYSVSYAVSDIDDGFIHQRWLFTSMSYQDGGWTDGHPSKTVTQTLRN